MMFSELVKQAHATACEAWRRDAVIFGKAPSLLDAIKAKLAKNKTRSFRHGGKLL